MFSKCPECRTVVVICAECSTVYAVQNGTVGKEVGDMTGATRCTVCKSGPYHHDFPVATPEEIVAAGFTKENYE